MQLTDRQVNSHAEASMMHLALAAARHTITVRTSRCRTRCYCRYCCHCRHVGNRSEKQTAFDNACACTEKGRSEERTDLQEECWLLLWQDGHKPLLLLGYILQQLIMPER